MKIKTAALIKELQDFIKNHLSVAKKLLELDNNLLNYKADASVWSVLETIEHLNLYGNFYIPEIRKRIEESTCRSASSFFKSGLIGNYFAKSMLPKEQLNSMKTFKNMNPNGSILEKITLENFILQQNEMLQLLALAQKINLTKTKTSISISSLIKLRLGDTFRVCVYHDERHIQQAERAVDEAKKYKA